MGILNIRKTLRELKEAESDENRIQIAESKRPKEYTLLERGALDIAGLVQPEAVVSEPNYLQVGDEYTRSFWLHTLPTQVDNTWLAPILRFPYPLDVSITIQPMPLGPFLKEMRHQRDRDHAAIEKNEADGVTPPGHRIARWRDYSQFVRALEEGVTRPFQVMVVMTLRAKSVDELDRLSEMLQDAIPGASILQARWRHREGFQHTIPLLTDDLTENQIVRNLQTQGVMTMFPFASSDITHERGVLIGISQQTRSPIIVNRFWQPPHGPIENPNMAILGASGSGKSYYAKTEMLRWACLGVPSIVLDPSGEYRHLCEGLGGANITISLDSTQVINPLDFSNAVRPGHNALREKIAFMVDLLKVMLKDDGSSLRIDPLTKSLFENALQNVYLHYGYHVDDIDSQLVARSDHMPRLSEVVLMLARIARANRKPEVQERLPMLLPALQPFVGDGHLAPLFDRATTVELRSHFVNFNYQNLARQYLPMAMHLVLEFLRTSYFTEAQQESGVHRLLYIDEAQVLMEYPETAQFVEYCARQSRKYGIGLTVMTQNVGVFVLNQDGSDNKTGQGILQNCATKVLLKQQGGEREALQRIFRLTGAELSKLMGARPGEGLILVGEDTGWFTAHNMTSEEEHRMLSTTMSERAQWAAEARALEQGAPEEPAGRYGTGYEDRLIEAPQPPQAHPELPAAGQSGQEYARYEDEDEDDPFGQF